MIDFNKTIGLWFMTVTSTYDWLAAISRAENGRVPFQWRIRYDDVDNASGSGRSWHRGYFNCTEAEAIEKMRTMARHLSQHAQDPYYEALRGNKTDREFWDEWLAMPFVEIKDVKFIPAPVE